MADLKISQLSELVAFPATDDEFEIRDVSEAPAAENKRLTRGSLFNVPAARVYNSTTISHATSGTAQTLTFDSERFDTDSIHSTSSNTSRLTCNTAGVYLISGCVQFAFHATGRRQLAIALNGPTLIALRTQPAVTTDSGVTVVTIQTVYKLAATDYVELVANQTSGAALNMSAAGNYSPEFTMAYMGTG
jgi:hypothetical protein